MSLDCLTNIGLYLRMARGTFTLVDIYMYTYYIRMAFTLLTNELAAKAWEDIYWAGRRVHGMRIVLGLLAYTRTNNNNHTFRAP